MLGIHSFNQSIVSTSVSQSFSEALGCSMEQGRQGPGSHAVAGKWREKSSKCMNKKQRMLVTAMMKQNSGVWSHLGAASDWLQGKSI